jgi:predicted amidophosphoribosyltransferase
MSQASRRRQSGPSPKQRPAIGKATREPLLWTGPLVSSLPGRPGWPPSVRAQALELRRRRWDGNLCFALDYVSGCAGTNDPRRTLIRAFKRDEGWALDAARLVLRPALLEREDRLIRNSPIRWLVPLPGHLAGPAGLPLDRLCRDLASDVPWLVYLPGLLVRSRTIRQSSASESRPTVDEHRDSLRWRGARITGSVIMIDDVYTHGRISMACRQLLTEAGTRDIVLGCLSLTQS